MRFEIGGRIDGQGKEVESINMDELDALGDKFSAMGIEAVAISFLNAYATPEHENQAADALRRKLPETYVTAGTELSREWSEYERTTTVCANAYVGPALNRYIAQFENVLVDHKFGGTLFMMGSNGGVLTTKRARQEPVTLVESGPVGGCIGAAALARELGHDNVIAFDMGGTTAKCTLVTGGRFSVENATYIGGFETGFPIRAAVIDIIEVGAGGGSIAWLDNQKRLNVGPQSAGAAPGPACYGEGGDEPTVTDANLILGRLNHKNFLGGDIELDVGKARTALDSKIAAPLGYDDESGLFHMADGVLAIAVMRMASAIRKISIERGLDPRDFVLVAYGGGGPLHATQLARDLHIPIVVVPPEPANFSATGMLLANARVDTARTFLRALDDEAVAEIGNLFEEMRREVAATVAQESNGDITVELGAEMRYRGQKHSIRIDMANLHDTGAIKDVFLKQYRRRYGHADEEAPAEFVGLQLGAMATTPGPEVTRLGGRSGQRAAAVSMRSVWMPNATASADVAIYQRAALESGFQARGPVIVEEYGSTTIIGESDVFTVGALGEIRIDLGTE